MNWKNCQFKQAVAQQNVVAKGCKRTWLLRVTIYNSCISQAHPKICPVSHLVISHTSHPTTMTTDGLNSVAFKQYIVGFSIILRSSVKENKFESPV